MGLRLSTMKFIKWLVTLEPISITIYVTILTMIMMMMMMMIGTKKEIKMNILIMKILSRDISIEIIRSLCNSRTSLNISTLLSGTMNSRASIMKEKTISKCTSKDMTSIWRLTISCISILSSTTSSWKSSTKWSTITLKC